ncbi:PTS fructose transporter subunit IIC [Collinsella sp. AGMB00827]|uniref:PTS fructose transporter subunit IIC n=1 Tax=Collinsella ureilytica TaxID=2869515 RepID=A0ABS7MJW5_9ACTN|nr:PTS fructose transporter subunit IIC [Collinsella urealyticum]MBY4797671.1 PTS fructose transporter subunit IIC [Collinsella urealyticum]
MKQLQLKKHMMTAIAYLIPYVASSGMLMVIGNIMGGSFVDSLGAATPIPDLLTTLGGTALGFIPIVISTGIAYSIADKAGIAPGFVLGLLCKVDGYGFLGGLISGFLVGFLTKWLLKVVKVPAWVRGLLPQLILPLLVALIIGLAMQYVIGVPILWLTEGITSLLRSMQGNPGAQVAFGALVGVLSAVDYGGPINKVVFTFAIGLQSEGIGGPIANLIQASMIAPLGLTMGYFISRALRRNLFSDQETNALKTAFVMGCFQITEGSFPIILNDLLRITVCTALGSAVSGALCGFFDVASSVPSGGFLAIPGMNHPVEWVASMLIGSLVFALALQFLKRNPNTLAPEEPQESASSDALDELTFTEL